MPGKIIRLEPNDPRRVSASQGLSVDMIRYLALNFRSLNRQDLRPVVNFLKYRRGDGNLVQDIKSLVICRLACEAYSLSSLQAFKTIDDLLDRFPCPPRMKEFMIPTVHELGVGAEVIETCKPQAGDDPIVLRAKREALLFNLSEMIRDVYVEYNGIMSPKYRIDEFMAYFSWVLNLVRDHLPLMPDEMAALVQVHVFQPKLPFNIDLP